MADRYLNWLLSGGIGSGKSEVRRILEEHGLTTIDADEVGHEVLSPGGPAVEAVKARWPECVIGGKVDRKKLGDRVFADRDELKALELITHPHIFSMIQTRVDGAVPPLVVELPMLAQPFASLWPRIIVDASDEIRRRRAMARGASGEDVARRMSAQPLRGQYLAAADVVVPNEGDMGELSKTVELLIGSVLRVRQESTAN